MSSKSEDDIGVKEINELVEVKSDGVNNEERNGGQDTSASDSVINCVKEKMKKFLPWGLLLL